ncbi:50S ribosomal protein L33 [Malacoplasma penetrans]|nr:50S ribosomal protein L33 [Malacoplasma penetrans]RXY97090.1 50S ribosomal protein L33 [Malacoplasma penetrans]
MAKTVIMICEECLSRNYKTKTNPSRKERLELNKYCSNCKKKTLHKETR